MSWWSWQTCNYGWLPENKVNFRDCLGRCFHSSFLVFFGPNHWWNCHPKWSLIPHGICCFFFLRIEFLFWKLWFVTRNPSSWILWLYDVGWTTRNWILSSGQNIENISQEFIHLSFTSECHSRFSFFILSSSLTPDVFVSHFFYGSSFLVFLFFRGREIYQKVSCLETVSLSLSVDWSWKEEEKERRIVFTPLISVAKRFFPWLLSPWNDHCNTFFSFLCRDNFLHVSYRQFCPWIITHLPLLLVSSLVSLQHLSFFTLLLSNFLATLLSIVTNALKEIHLTVSNEYTDWTRSPSMTRATDIFESLVETLSDATLVAPAVKTALLHDRSKRSKSSAASTYFYEFAHATERGDYPSQLGCVAGDDLPYIFGAPLVPGMNLGYFSSSYTKQETSFSEMVMTYLGNFVRTGLVLHILFPQYLSLKSVSTASLLSWFKSRKKWRKTSLHSCKKKYHKKHEKKRQLRILHEIKQQEHVFFMLLPPSDWLVGFSIFLTQTRKS